MPCFAGTFEVNFQPLIQWDYRGLGTDFHALSHGLFKVFRANIAQWEFAMSIFVSCQM